MTPVKLKATVYPMRGTVSWSCCCGRGVHISDDFCSGCGSRFTRNDWTNAMRRRCDTWRLRYRVFAFLCRLFGMKATWVGGCSGA